MYNQLINNVTLLAVATQEKWYESTLKAINISIKHIPFKHVKFLSCRPFISDVIQYIPMSKITEKEYSIFMVLELYKYVNTEHVLCIQDDGFIINPTAWTDDFLEYDYIGAPWPHGTYKVGNGGFSLRSKKLLDILSLDEMQYRTRSEVEDVFICQTMRPSLESRGIKFPSPSIAAKFSVEQDTTETRGQTHRNRHSIKSFGFHCKNSDIIKHLEEY